MTIVGEQIRLRPGPGTALGLTLAAFVLCMRLQLGTAHAELMELRQVAGGMECAECARNLRMEAGRLDGVVAADASWNRRILTLRFRPGSLASLTGVRALVRRHHFSVGETEIVARGRVARSAAGTWSLSVSGSGESFDLVLSPPADGALAERLTAAAAGETAAITIRGRVAGDSSAGPTSTAPMWVLDIEEGAAAPR